MPVALPAGVLLDRFTAARVVIAANLLSGVAFAGYMLVGRAWQLVMFALLAGIAFWLAGVLRRLETLHDLDRLMRQADSMTSTGEPPPLHRLAAIRPSTRRTR